MLGALLLGHKPSPGEVNCILKDGKPVLSEVIRVLDEHQLLVNIDERQIGQVVL